MEGISDICIVGFDERRLPRVVNQPYVDLFFKLSHKVPVDWSRDFNHLMASYQSKPKIDEKEGLFINTWVRKPDEIAAHLDLLKKKIVECTLAYIERLNELNRAANKRNTSSSGEVTEEQASLNKIVAELEFDVPQMAE